jgi:hypothetical protein
MITKVAKSVATVVIAASLGGEIMGAVTNNEWIVMNAFLMLAATLGVACVCGMMASIW